MQRQARAGQPLDDKLRCSDGLRVESLQPAVELLVCLESWPRRMSESRRPAASSLSSRAISGAADSSVSACGERADSRTAPAALSNSKNSGDLKSGNWSKQRIHSGSNRSLTAYRR